MHSKNLENTTTLPGNHGQFGESAATEAHLPLRATHRVTVKPVVPRKPMASRVTTNNPVAEDESEAHPS